MKITGLQKMTLLDYPGRIACTVFLQGCNFRCPFCHNSDLLPPEGETAISVEELLSFLKKRRGMLDGVCITGGEPTVQKDLPQLLRAIKALGYSVKLDTNGTNPAMLKALVQEGLVDYVAMDIKNSPAKYPRTSGVPGLNLQKVEESMTFLLAGGLDYEFRTTVVRELHEAEDFREIADWIRFLGSGRRAKRFFLQRYVDRDSVLCPGYSAPEDAETASFLEAIAPAAEYARIRGEE
ncbi:MAG: anaerobic ribonucleoside-triphosphate reductase activating protein [Oscillospiraceae bacterium]|nr:anaerobic ribonucleoside-triphosphate reductase activating protein [Oscillospiraceae bacterium]